MERKIFSNHQFIKRTKKNSENGTNERKKGIRKKTLDSRSLKMGKILPNKKEIAYDKKDPCDSESKYVATKIMHLYLFQEKEEKNKDGPSFGNTEIRLDFELKKT